MDVIPKGGMFLLETRHLSGRKVVLFRVNPDMSLG